MEKLKPLSTIFEIYNLFCLELFKGKFDKQ